MLNNTVTQNNVSQLDMSQDNISMEGKANTYLSSSIVAKKVMPSTPNSTGGNIDQGASQSALAAAAAATAEPLANSALLVKNGSEQ